MDREIIVKLEDVGKVYQTGAQAVTALSHIDLRIRRGDFLGLVGPSGSGKTTLLNIIGLLDEPSQGWAEVLGHCTVGLNQKTAARLRNRHIGFVFQTFNLFPQYTAFENVEFALILQGWPAAKRREAAMEALAWVDLADRAQKRPHQLSGGECQRVAVARAMVKKPELVLADEPSANLDAANTYRILDIMKRLNQALGTAFIFATHDEKVMERLIRLVKLKDGRIAEEVTRDVGS